MRTVIWLVLLFAVAVVAALTLGDNDGLASFYWGAWRVDMSLNFFVLAALGLGFVIMSAVQGIGGLLRLPTAAREWRALRRERSAQNALREAQAEHFAGRYTRAHKAALSALTIRQGGDGVPPDAEFEMLAYMLAAASLHKLQDRAGRDELQRRLLKLVRRNGARAIDDGARLLATEWALDDRDAARAEALLAELPPGVARRTLALRLKLQAARLARRPREALQTAHLLAHHKAFAPAAAQALLRSLAFEVLDAAHDPDQLRRAWQQFETTDQGDPYVACRAARRARALGVPEDGRRWLRPAWDRLADLPPEARSDAALALVDCIQGIGPEWLPRLEAAQRTFSAEPAIQAAVGSAFADRGLWGKARAPLETASRADSLPAEARRMVWRRLAQLARDEGDELRAIDCERQAAAS